MIPPTDNTTKTANHGVVPGDEFRSIGRLTASVTTSEYPAAACWRGLLTFAYMTGWRVSEIRALRWDDVSSDKGTALTQAEDNKGRRDELVPLRSVVVEHLRALVDGSITWPTVFYWPHHRRTLRTDFYRIQDVAGVEDHYGFHDLRRAFATVSAPRLTPDAMQALMGHKSYQTTQKYINLSRQLDEAVETLEVPDILRGKS